MSTRLSNYNNCKLLTFTQKIKESLSTSVIAFVSDFHMFIFPNKQQITIKSNEVSNIHKNKYKRKMKDDVISNTHANRDKRRMKIKDNVVSNIQEQKKVQRKKIKDDAIFNTQNSKDKQKMRVKGDAIIKQVQIITTSRFFLFFILQVDHFTYMELCNIITRLVQIFHFTSLCLMFIVHIIIMCVLKSLLITQTNTFCIIGSWQMLLESN